MGDLTETIYSVRAKMVDGAVLDLLLFARAIDANQHARYLQKLGILGIDRVFVVPRRVIGSMRGVDRRAIRRTEYLGGGGTPIVKPEEQS